MHWSRYLDAGIAGMLTLAALVLPPCQRPNLVTLILWPSLLACADDPDPGPWQHVRLFGPAAAIGALAVFFSWGKLGGEFVAPRIDHHNIQILCATAVFYLSLDPGAGACPWGIGRRGNRVLDWPSGLRCCPFYATIWGIDGPATGL